MRRITLIGLFFLVMAVVIWVWGLPGERRADAKNRAYAESAALSLSYAANFGVDSCGGFRILWVRNGKMPPLRWLLRDSLSPSNVPPDLAELPRLALPVERMTILSSTYLGYLSALKVPERIVGVDSKKYIADSAFYRRVDSLRVSEVGEGVELSPEKIYGLRSDAIFAFSTGETIHDAYPKLSQLKMPVVLTSEWREKHPLGKAEWIKFFGVLTGREALADSLFSQSEKNYLAIKGRLDLLKDSERPVVFTGTPSSGSWLASSGNSFMAALIRDAGGIYLWRSDSASETLSLPFERALIDVQKADVWINAGGYATLDEISANEERIRLFPVWKSGEIYGYDLRKGPAGGLDYYESAVVKPDSLLLDVAKILHPALFPGISSKWYRKLSNI